MALQERESGRLFSWAEIPRGRSSRQLPNWPGVTVEPHRFGGIEFREGRREIGHLHGDPEEEGRGALSMRGRSLLKRLKQTRKAERRRDKTGK
jgi:hypothetical protein